MLTFNTLEDLLTHLESQIKYTRRLEDQERTQKEKAYRKGEAWGYCHAADCVRDFIKQHKGELDHD